MHGYKRKVVQSANTPQYTSMVFAFKSEYCGLIQITLGIHLQFVAFRKCLEFLLKTRNRNPKINAVTSLSVFINNEKFKRKPKTLLNICSTLKHKAL